jgi:hypothetical protein
VDLAVAQLALVLVALEQPEQVLAVLVQALALAQAPVLEQVAQVRAPDQVLAVEPLLVEQPADLEQQLLQLNSPIPAIHKKACANAQAFLCINISNDLYLVILDTNRIQNGQ